MSYHQSKNYNIALLPKYGKNKIAIKRFYTIPSNPKYKNIKNYSITETMRNLSYLILLIWFICFITTLACTQQAMTPKMIIMSLIFPLQTHGDYTMYNATDNKSYWKELA